MVFQSIIWSSEIINNNALYISCVNLISRKIENCINTMKEPDRAKNDMEDISNVPKH